MGLTSGEILKKKIIVFKRTKNISSSKLKEKIYNNYVKSNKVRK